jgi:hypothetical protein
MKILAVLVLTLVTVLLVASSTSLTAKIKQTSQEKPIEVSNQPKEKTVIGNASPGKENAYTSSDGGQVVGGDLPEGNSKSTNEAVPNGVPLDTQNGQDTSQTLANETATTHVPPPDGRIYTGGEEPYAYIPTQSPKEIRLPIVPVPDE